MHAGLAIFLWLIGVALLQFAARDLLIAALLVSGLVALFYARARCFRLLRRIRYLLLAIIVLFAGFTPGEAIFANYPVLSPSREGVWLAIEHAGRVLAVVFCVAMMMEWLPSRRLVGALYALMRPFESIGFPAARVAVRTLLVLEHVDSERKSDWRDWLAVSDDSVQEPIQIKREVMRLFDWTVLCGVMMIVPIWMTWLQ